MSGGIFDRDCRSRPFSSVRTRTNRSTSEKTRPFFSERGGTPCVDTAYVLCAQSNREETAPNGRSDARASWIPLEYFFLFKIFFFFFLRLKFKIESRLRNAGDRDGLHCASRPRPGEGNRKGATEGACGRRARVRARRRRRPRTRHRRPR